ncbi:hypothetical protein CIRG_02659 [Coccidioides immitis RMSCC 2394]|uniref:Uncharacterized protein n=1 Tax=Coccidioides immitis RMSCC 2394 TaxID=404692 RepID=A0A0J7AZQ1_COCIT|nr:hypothetical protein CIRG_02659 [Coccidioides immitis RMSCC 2394]
MHPGEVMTTVGNLENRPDLHTPDRCLPMYTRGRSGRRHQYIYMYLPAYALYYGLASARRRVGGLHALKGGKNGSSPRLQHPLPLTLPSLRGIFTSLFPNIRPPYSEWSHSRTWYAADWDLKITRLDEAHQSKRGDRGISTSRLPRSFSSNRLLV